MIAVRRDRERLHCFRRRQEFWLTFHPQGPGEPLAVGFGALEAFDENRLPPGATAASRSGQEAEVVTYVLEGALAQEDSRGRSGVIRAGEFQRMTTGRLGRRSERNPSQADWAHVFRMSLSCLESEPGFTCEQRFFPVAERRGALRIVASPDGRTGSLRIRQDTLIYSSILDVGQHLVHELPPGRTAWLHVVRGEAALNDIVLGTGDGVGVRAEPAVSFTARERTEILLLDLEDRQQVPWDGSTS